MDDITAYFLHGIWLLIKYSTLVFLGWTILSFAFNPRRQFENITETWYRSFNNQHFPIQDFYMLVQEKVKQKKIVGIDMNIVEYSDGIYTRRDYLQIVRHNEMILICAAPLGTDFFISVRQGQPIDIIQDFFMRVPIVGIWITKFVYRKNFYKLDTNAMYHSTIKRCVEAAIESHTLVKAERVLLQPESNNREPEIDYM